MFIYVITENGYIEINTNTIKTENNKTNMIDSETYNRIIHTVINCNPDIYDRDLLQKNVIDPEMFSSWMYSIKNFFLQFVTSPEEGRLDVQKILDALMPPAHEHDAPECEHHGSEVTMIENCIQDPTDPDYDNNH